MFQEHRIKNTEKLKKKPIKLHLKTKLRKAIALQNLK